MTSPQLATATEHGRMYARTRGGTPQVPSITTVMGVLNENMDWWDALCAAKAAMKHADRLVAIQQLPQGRERWSTERVASDWLMEAAERDRNQRGHEGDLMHDYAEQVARHQLGEATTADVAAARATAEAGGAGKLLPAFDQFWSDWKPRVLSPEATVWGHEVGYAGTTDLICELDVGDTTVTGILDYKGKRALFKRNGQRKDSDLRDVTGMQLTAGAHADELWVPGPTPAEDSWVPFPYRIDIGLAVGVAPDGYVVRQYDIHDPLLWATFTALRQSWDWYGNGADRMSGILNSPTDVRLSTAQSV